MLWVTVHVHLSDVALIPRSVTSLSFPAHITVQSQYRQNLHPYHHHLVSLAFCPDPHLFLPGESRENLPCGQRRPHQHIPFCNSPWASTGSWCTDCCIAFSSGFRGMSTWDSSACVIHLGWRCQGPEEPYTSWENRPNVSVIPTPRDLEALFTGLFLYLFWGWVLLCSTG